MMCVSMRESWCVDCMAHLWRSEKAQWDSFFLSIFVLCFGGQTPVGRGARQVPLPSQQSRWPFQDFSCWLSSLTKQKCTCLFRLLFLSPAICWVSFLILLSLTVRWLCGWSDPIIGFTAWVIWGPQSLRIKLGEGGVTCLSVWQFSLSLSVDHL